MALGYRWADPVAGFVITAFIAQVDWKVTTELGAHLMDAVDAALTDQAQAGDGTVLSGSPTPWNITYNPACDQYNDSTKTVYFDSGPFAGTGGSLPTGQYSI